MKKALQIATELWLRVAAVFAAVFRFARAGFAKACAVAHVGGEGKAC